MGNGDGDAGVVGAGEQAEANEGDREGGAVSASEGENAVPAAEHRYPERNRKPNPKYVVNSLIAPVEPKTYEEAMQSPEATLWQQAMEEELGALHGQGTWRVEHPPKGTNVIPGKWVFKIKRSVEGDVERYKARYV